MTTVQEKLFLKNQGDQYFQRNDIRPNKYILNAVKFLQPNSNDYIFEIGCGSGATLNTIKLTYNSKVYGLDPSKKATNYAKKNYKLKNIYSDTFLNFKLKKKFDIIIDGGFLHVTPNNIINKTIEKISNMMKANLYFILWNYDTPYSYINDWKYHKNIKSYKRNYINVINTINNKLYLLSKKQFMLGTGKEIKFYNEKINIDKIITTMIYKKIK